MKAWLLRGLAALAGVSAAGTLLAQSFTLSVIHTNDIHSRVLPVRTGQTETGGFARQAGLIQKLRSGAKNPIVLFAGDAFQGTIFFNVYEGMAEAAFLNLAGYQAMTLGNHEFDKGPSVLGKFLDQAQFPVLACNIDVSSEPVLAGRIKPSTVVTVNGTKVGVVGAITPDTPNISSPGPNVKWLDLVPAIQKEVDLLTVQGISHIVLLSHLGYDEDLETAPKLRGVDVIVGGHSHTVLGTLNIPGFTRKDGEYPTPVKGQDGKTTLVVQAWEWGKVVGQLDVTFDAKGDVQKWAGTPHVVDDKAPSEPRIAAMVAALTKPVEALTSQKVGESKIELNRGGENRENLMGYVVADAQLGYFKEKGAVAAFMNPGGVRRNLPAGPISYGDAIEVQPFSNTLYLFDLPGSELKKVLEDGLTNSRLLIPSAGTVYEVDLSRPAGARLVSLKINGEEVVDDKVYKIVTNSFMAGGGDSLFTLRDTKSPKVDTGMMDVDALIEHLKKGPITEVSLGRIVRK